MLTQRPTCKPPTAQRQAISQVDYQSLTESLGGLPIKSRSLVHFFTGQTRVSGAANNWTQLDPLTPSDIVAIEIVDLFVPVPAGLTDPGYLYVEISVNNDPLEHLMVNGRWFTAAIPTMTVDNGRVSMKRVCGERVLIRFLDRPVRSINTWTMRVFQYNTATGAFEFYPLTDDLTFENNVAFKAEVLRYT